MPLSPMEATNCVNEQVTVEMRVKAAKNCPHCWQIFLDSEVDHHAPDNLAVAVSSIGKAKFKEAMIDDPAGYFKGKTIRVTGTLRLRRRQLMRRWTACEHPRTISTWCP